MPTGYTAQIEKGITFEAFAMECARAFGALIELRDDMTAPIPEAFTPSNYHADAAKKAAAELKALSAMTPAQAQKNAEKAHREAVEANERTLTAAAALLTKYDAMLAEVRAWTPPTKDHQGLKDFMVQQITDSIKFDCDQKWAREEQAKLAATKPSGARWIVSQRAMLEREIAYHTEHHAADVKRAREQTQWVKELRDSLLGVAK